jgi:hypothetical protein
MNEETLQKIIHMLTAEAAQTQKQITVLEKEIAASPEGRLLTSISNGVGQFKYRTGTGSDRRVHLSKSEQELIRKLAQKRYAQELLKIYTRNAVSFQKAAFALKAVQNPKSAFSKLPKQIQSYCSCAQEVLPDEEYVAQWRKSSKEVAATARPVFHTENCIYATNNGEKVRSKSEMMIANLLMELHLPYQYEKPLFLNGSWHYPDFTILDLSTRTEVYYEHFGLMDQENYQASAFAKIARYEHAGFALGNQFLFSFESAQTPFDIGQIRHRLQLRFLDKPATGFPL